MKLQILIPTLKSREETFKPNYSNVRQQIQMLALENEISIIIAGDNGENSIGHKRNKLLQAAVADYVCFLDDDDPIMTNYIPTIWEGIKQNKDCVELKGIMTTNGKWPTPFNHSIKYDSYFDAGGVYYRPPNHLNPIRRELILPFEFPNISLGEDTDWALRVAKAQVIKTEASVNQPYYYYQWITQK